MSCAGGRQEARLELAWVFLFRKKISQTDKLAFLNNNLSQKIWLGLKKIKPENLASYFRKKNQADKVG